MGIRRLIGLALCVALGVGLVPAAAAAGADQDLERITAQVKETLGLDTEEFDDFRGSAREDVLLGKRWSLSWEGDGASLSILADDQGKIFSYDRYDSVSEVAVSRGLGGRLDIPRLPEDKSQAARQAAEAFLTKVLEAGTERVELEGDARPSLRRETYRFSGTLLLNDLPSPIRCSVSVRASDLAVTSFWRGDRDSGYLNGVGPAVRNVTQAQARRTLQGALTLEARYVLTDDGKTAVVRYVPVAGHDYYVDGETGQLVDLTQLYEQLWRNGANETGASASAPMAEMNAADAAGDAKSSALSQAERDGAAILQGALPKEALDQAVRGAWPELGLERYTLASASYNIEEKPMPEGQEPTADDYDITCRLTYGRQEDQLLQNRYVLVDAKTGALREVNSTRYWRGEGEDNLRYALTLTQAQSVAEAALETFAGTHYAALGLKESADALKEERWEHRFTYQQRGGEWFYAGNAYTVGVDATDGSLSCLRGSFDEEVTLVAPKSVVSPSEAAGAYAAAMDAPFSYLEVPVSVSLAAGEVAPLLREAGYNYVLALKTGYVLRQPEDSYVLGVDAESGQAVTQPAPTGEEDALQYSDLDGHWVREAAQALAAYQIGLRDGALRPEEGLTQRDALALLLSVDGFRYGPEPTGEDTDQLYQQAYFLGLATPETRDPDRGVTRGELVRLILDAAGYARVAALPGIFRCDYADSGAIPAQEMGYAALAQGLGLVRGGSDGAYAAQRPATRGEAVAMLYQYMK